MDKKAKAPLPGNELGLEHRVERLEHVSHFSFDCGESSLNNYLQRLALQNDLRRLGRTFVRGIPAPSSKRDGVRNAPLRHSSRKVDIAIFVLECLCWDVVLQVQSRLRKAILTKKGSFLF